MYFVKEFLTDFVYEDVNKNAVKGRREKGIADCSVSNGIEVVKTDQNGSYTVPVFYFSSRHYQ